MFTTGLGRKQGGWVTFKLSGREFEQFRQLILHRSGLVIEESRQEVLRFSLEQRLEKTGHVSLAAYYSRLQERGDREFQELIQLLTIGETFFFRTDQHWQSLKTHVLPELIEQRRKEAAERSRHAHTGKLVAPTLRIWSAGCASGEEPYSLAILLLELIPDLPRWNITLLGSDINEQALDTAIRGHFNRRSVETTMDPAYRDRYFTIVDNNYVLSQRVRQLVEFRALNLVHDPYPSLLNNTKDMDLILCRNVTIYFESELAREVQHKLYRSLAAGGFLLLGHAETFNDRLAESKMAERDGVVFYTRPPLAPTLPPMQEFYRQDPIKVPIDRWSHSLPESVPAPARRGEQHLAHGLAYLRESRFDLAKTELDEALKLLPSNPQVYCALGEIYAALSQEDHAIHQWKQSIELDSLYPLPYFFLGILYKSRSNYQKAEEHLRQAIYLDPQMVLARFHLAQLFQADGHRQEAAREYRNTQRYLQNLPADQFVEHAEGFTIGLVQRLCEKALSELNNGHH